MKLTLTLFAAIALAAPLAVADGADISLRYLESSDPECSGWSSYGGDSNWTYVYDPNGGYSYSGYSWWTYTDSSACHSDFQTASIDVSDDSGSLASASVHGSETSNRSYTDSSSYSGWGYYSPGDNTSSSEGYYSDYSSSSRQHHSNNAWDRSADASVAGHSVHAGRGCAYSNGASHSTWSSNYGRYDGNDSYSSTYETARESRSYGHSCSDGADAAGATAGMTDQCAFHSQSEDQSSSWSSSYGSGNSSWSTDSSRDVCRHGVTAQNGNTSAFAGSRWACSQQSWESGHSNETTGASYGECVNDTVRVEGPGGMVVAAGTWHRSGTDCYEGECSWWSYDYGGLRIEWEHNPLGPGGVNLYHPLP